MWLTKLTPICLVCGRQMTRIHKDTLQCFGCNRIPCCVNDLKTVKWKVEKIKSLNPATKTVSIAA